MKDRLRDLSRRDLFRILGGVGAASLLSACGSQVEPTSKGNRWADTQLAQANDPILKSIEFYFDNSYQRGSLAMEICFSSSSGEYRITRLGNSQNIAV